MIQVLVYALLWILLMGVAIFATQNTLFVTIKFLAFESINLPLGLVLVFSSGLGAIAMTIWQNTQVVESEPLMPTDSKQKSDRGNFSSYSTYRASTSSASASSKSTGTSTSTKSTPKNSQADDFDEEWDDDWG